MNALVPLTESNSFALRDQIMQAALLLPEFAGFTPRKTKFLRIETADLPTFGLYFLDDNQMPEGDGNAGELSFMVTTRLALSVIIVNNDPDASEETLDRLYMVFMNGIWRDADLTRLTLRRDDVGFEAIPRQTRRLVPGNIGLNNETPITELQYEFSLVHRWDFPPIITDDLLDVEMVTSFGRDPVRTQQVRFPVRWPPAIVTPPAVTGAVTSGSVLTTSNGTWAQQPTAYAYAWLRGSGRDLTPIAGETAQTYTLSAADVGHMIRSLVTASNAAGAQAAASGPVGPITT